jgi:NAD-dependent deacetylase
MAEPGFDREQLLRRLGDGRLLVLTGAGMSAESGVPTFRDAQTGLWANFRAEDLATPEAFARDPTTVWRWYAWRRELVAAAQPNAGHLALARIEAELGERCLIVTQNVDGLHQAAGSRRVIELHGNLLRSICHITRQPVDPGWLRAQTGEPPASPHHPRGLARPDVVWFGESLPSAALEQACAAAEDCSVCLVVGTSGLVQPAASLPLLARRSGAWLVEINIERSALSAEVDVFLPLSAAQALPGWAGP